MLQGRCRPVVERSNQFRLLSPARLRRSTSPQRDLVNQQVRCKLRRCVIASRDLAVKARPRDKPAPVVIATDLTVRPTTFRHPHSNIRPLGHSTAIHNQDSTRRHANQPVVSQLKHHHGCRHEPIHRATFEEAQGHQLCRSRRQCAIRISVPSEEIKEVTEIFRAVRCCGLHGRFPKEVLT